MKSKKKLLEKSLLYAILDKEAAGKRPLAALARRLKDAKAGIVQYRDKKSKKTLVLKNARLLKKEFRFSDTLFIVNDYPDVAWLADADGVHIGQDDISISCARALLGNNKLIGVSCHNLAQALKAQKEGADYLGIGPIFPTPTKPEYKPVGTALLKQIRGKIKIPFFAIGGIDFDNIKEVLSAGARKVAMCRAILG